MTNSFPTLTPPMSTPSSTINPPSSSSAATTTTMTFTLTLPSKCLSPPPPYQYQKQQQEKELSGNNIPATKTPLAATAAAVRWLRRYPCSTSISATAGQQAQTVRWGRHKSSHLRYKVDSRHSSHRRRLMRSAYRGGSKARNKLAGKKRKNR